MMDWVARLLLVISLFLSTVLFTLVAVPAIHGEYHPNWKYLLFYTAYCIAFSITALCLIK